ncbi:MAG: hypothetical protein ABSG43_05010 [Solirubrobacteraceae bacterium]
MRDATHNSEALGRARRPLRHEATRTGTTVAEVTRAALAAHLGAGTPRRLAPFVFHHPHPTLIPQARRSHLVHLCAHLASLGQRSPPPAPA